ncbi:ATP-binding protein [Pseudomonas sp. GD03944]|uniref:sensor histidine kinase n=1 Tax=Pseudomonas sp. GD03944 TaxID=2975409 RepID=UPI00244D62A8|nr:ATP-binding protein [Pseudomonas sp. GD03944]MDH1263224.1 ATP-binding protein [Pseudomonas sp. GD03944]
MGTDAKVQSNSTTLVEGADSTLVAATPWRRFAGKLRRLNRSTQFLITATLIMGLTMAFVGLRVSQQIRLAAAQSAGEGAAIYMEAYLDEYVQELAQARSLSPANTAAIDKLMADTSLNQHIVSVKIWLPDGSNVYSTSKLAVYRNYPQEPIDQVMQGRIVTRLSPLEHAEHDYERSLGIPLYETYVPLREFGSGRIVAIGEFYEMEHEIGSIHQQVWAVIAVATMAMLLVLFVIVRRGDRIIDRQQVALRRQMQEQAALHRQNVALQHKVTLATQEFSTINELTHRRLGADLHDGPAQLLTLILLRLDELGEWRDRYRQDGGNLDNDALETIRSAAQETLQEIRNMSRGLALPEINELSLGEELELVVQRHEQRTDSKVELQLGTLPGEVPLPYKICIYRLVQEALNNAFRHAGGKRQRVSATLRDGDLEVQIEDDGDGISDATVQAQGRGRSRLGLVGMRYRVESLGGLFSIESAPGQGTRIRASFTLPA